MTLEQLLQQIRTAPLEVQFAQVISTIDANYQFTPTAFTNGELTNAADTNNGSCKIFAFAQLQGLDTAETLACFGDYYRVDVLQNPQATNHGNIRNFIEHGWQGIDFETSPLTAREG